MDHEPTDYQKLLWGALQKAYQDADKSILPGTDGRFDYTTFYNQVIMLAKEALPVDAEVKRRYDRLYGEGHFVCEDEDDVNVYIYKVANKHIGKFRALYKHLFESYHDLFSHQVDLIVWGCGCGLDLIAFYETAMQTGTPETWVSVRTITLIDLSKAALTRAKECAEMLFPCAEVTSISCDLRDEKSVDTVFESFKPRFLLTPRIHLFSNILDLLGDRFSQHFWHKITTSNERGYNDFVIAFSPLYRSIDAFRAPDEKDLEYTEGIEKTIQKSRCYFYRLRSDRVKQTEENCKDSSLLQSLRHLIESKSTYEHPSLDDYAHLWKKCQEKYASSYEAIREVRLGCKKTHENETANVSHLVFVLCPIRNNVKFLILDIESNKCPKECWKECQNMILKLAGLPANEANEFSYSFTWERRKDPGPCDSATYPLLRELFFPTQSADIDPLPDLKEKKSNLQTKIIYDRKQCRKVRGGPGTGKTYTLLWHAIMAYKRTHLPILIVGKTNTLSSICNRRLFTRAGHFFASNLDYNAFQIQTYNKVLCNLAKSKLTCPPSKQKCSRCNKELLDNHRPIQNPFPQYGAILIDEAQGIPPAIVRFIYRISRNSNPWREFYLFCDEEQSLRDVREKLVENEDESRPEKRKKLVVDVPKEGKFGRFITLKENFRFQVPEILKVCRHIQLHMPHYDIDELGMKIMISGERRLQIIKAFAVRTIEPSSESLLNTLQQEINELIKIDDKKSIAIIFNTEEAAIWLTHHITEPLRAPFTKGFYSTHYYTSEEVKEKPTDTKRYREGAQDQKLLRKTFYERADTLHITTIDCAQGHTFDKVIVVLGDKNAPFSLSLPGNLELLFTACSRARTALRVIDATGKHEVYELLKQFN